MDYETLREKYRPHSIRFLVIAESPPPDADVPSSRHFYRTDQTRRNDRLFSNTIWALYPDAPQTEKELEAQKEAWLRRFQHDGFYMIEALEESQKHEITKSARQALIREHIPHLLTRLTQLVDSHTKIILIKSNVFEVAASPLRQAGFTVLNSAIVDYPGQYSQAAYRHKLATLVKAAQ